MYKQSNKPKNTMKARYTLLFITSIIISSLFLQSCDAKKPAVGEEDLIYVVADSSEYYELEAALLQVFGKIIYTPQPENLFDIKRISVNRLDDVKNKKNIIITAPLNSGSYTSQYINSILDSTVKNLVSAESDFVINKYDMWARDQLVSILTAPDIEKLNQQILTNHENLLYYFQKISDKRLFQSLYNEKYEQKDIEAKLLDQYGWIIYVQADFLLAQDSPEDKFVWLRRAPGSDMERWIFVHWIDDASPDFLEKDSIYAQRNKMTSKHFVTIDNSSRVEIADSYISSKEVNFLGRYALMTQGLWRMDDKSMGGPFINYTFYDEASKRIYMLDGSIYAPKYYKKRLLQQVDVLLQSFMTKDQLSEDKIDDLLSRLK